MLSFWEKTHFTHADFLIVGSGIIGLSTAITLKEKYPNRSVVILERGIFPSGASTKNAGFACFGSLTELVSDLETMSETVVLDLVEQRWTGLQKLKNRLGDANIDFQNHGGYELITQAQSHFLNQLEAINDFLFPLFKKSVFILKDELISPFGLNNEVVKHLVFNPFEGQINTGKMMKTLLQFAQFLGIEVLTGCEVIEFEENDLVKIWVRNPVNGEVIGFETEKLAFCTNGFTQKFFPQYEVKPCRGQVLITEPIENLPFKGSFHFDEGFYYYRNFDNRILFGGGRNLDFEGETTEQMTTTNLILDDLKSKLSEVIIPQTPFQVEHTWAGIMGFGEDKQPLLKKVSNQVFIGARLGGMGVAIGSHLGESLAKMILA